MDGEPTEARAVAKEGLLLHRETGNLHGQADAMTTLGRVYLSVELLDQAVQIFDRVLEMYRRVDDRRNTVLTLVRLGQLRRDLGHRDDAQNTYDEAIAAAKRLGDRALTARVQSSAAALQRELGQPERAGALLSEALATQSAVDPDGRPETLVRMSDLQLDKGDYSGALATLQDAWARQRAAGNQVGAARSMARVAQIRFMQGQLQMARELYEDAGREQERIKDRRGISRTRVGLAQVYVAEGKHALAIALLEVELAEQQSRGLRVNECAILIHMAATHFHGAENDAARICLNRAHDLAARLGYPMLMAACRAVGAAPERVFEPAAVPKGGPTVPIGPP
jgi:tetratricopeptide (TPR) repeat protein